MSKIKCMNPIDVLLVEDSDADAFLTQHAFKRAKVAINIHRAKDGEEALTMLKGNSPYENFVTPDLILLDINLPKIDGKEVLKEVKSTDQLKSIPVIVLSGSSSKTDIDEMYALQAKSYMTKPIDIVKFMDIVSSIDKG